MKIALIIDGKSPTVDIVFEANFSRLRAEGKIASYEYFFDSILPALSKIKEYNAVIFIRSGSLKSIILHAFLKEHNIKTFYYTDDYLIDVPGVPSVSKMYRGKTIFIAIHSMLATRIIASTEPLRIAYGFPEKTTVIPGTLNCSTLRVSKETLEKRKKTMSACVNIVIVQSDRLFLSSEEISNLRNVVSLIKEEFPINLHLFGNIEGIASEEIKITHHSFREFIEFQKFLSESDFHIALAPITNESEDAGELIFAECKNKIKFLNFSLAGIPTVYSAPYKNKIEYDFCLYSDNSTESWHAAITSLIKKPDIYDTQVSQPLSAVCRDYDVAVSKKMFFDILKDTENISDDRKKLLDLHWAYTWFSFMRIAPIPYRIAKKILMKILKHGRKK